jgi:hypothetical protein
MIKGTIFHTNHGAVEIKSISQVLNEMNRIAVTIHDAELIQPYIIMQHMSLMAACSTYDRIGNESVSYLDKIPSIQKPRDFKELRKNFAEYLLTTKEVVFTGSIIDGYNTTPRNNMTKVKLENLLQGIEDSVAKLAAECARINDSFALFPLKSRTWCLLAEDVWCMVSILKATEGSILGISPIPRKAKSWVIIEVEKV